jgi:hypothetical protein
MAGVRRYSGGGHVLSPTVRVPLTPIITVLTPGVVGESELPSLGYFLFANHSDIRTSLYVYKCD